jgi:V-type H+-transporting ATPase subunit d
MCPTFGYLFPGLSREIHRAANIDQLRDAVKIYDEYRLLLENVPNPEKREEMENFTGKSLDDMVFANNVKKYSMAYEQQFHYAAFYAFLKLKEQEIKNVEYMFRAISTRTEEFDARVRKYEDFIPFEY